MSLHPHPFLFCRALARMGNVYFQQQQWKDAIKYFDKSLTEHRNADVLKKKQIVSHTIVFYVCADYIQLCKYLNVFLDKVSTFPNASYFYGACK